MDRNHDGIRRRSVFPGRSAAEKSGAIMDKLERFPPDEIVPPAPKPLTADQLFDRIEHQRRNIAALRKYWEEILPEFPVPADSQFRTWVGRHSLDIIVAGLDVAMERHLRRLKKDGERPWTADDVCAYASGVMKNKQKDANET